MDPDGTVYAGEGTGFFSGRKEISRIDENGTVWTGEGDGFFSTKKEVGRVDVGGDVWIGDKWKEQKIGFIEALRSFASGAALLLYCCFSLIPIIKNYLSYRFRIPAINLFQFGTI